MKLAIASDHAGYPLKQHLVNYLRETGHEVIDLGVDDPSIRADYPDAAKDTAAAIQDGRAERGIICCGSGVGVCIAANKIRGIYAGLVHDHYSAAQGVEHDNMNVLCLGSRIIGVAVAEELVDAFIGAEFINKDRYLSRHEMLKEMESGQS